MRGWIPLVELAGDLAPVVRVGQRDRGDSRGWSYDAMSTSEVELSPLNSACARIDTPSPYGQMSQLRDSHAHGADAGVEVPVPVTVTGVDPVVGAWAVVGSAQHVGFGAPQGVEEQ